MTKEHAVLIAGFLGAVALQLSGIAHWQDALQPSWIAGLLAQVALMVRACYSQSGRP